MAFNVSDLFRNFQADTTIASDATSSATELPSAQQGKMVNVQNGVQTLNTGIKLLQDMLVGDTFTATVAGISKDNVLLQLPDGSNLTAQLSNNAQQLAKGQTLTFQVASNQGSTISVQTLMPEGQENVLIAKALQAAGLIQTKGNTAIVKELLDQNMPINKDTIGEIVKNTAKYPDTSLRTISNLMKLEIPVTSENIGQFEAYQNFEHTISGQMNQLPANINQTFSELVSQGRADEAVKLMQTVVDTLYSNISSEGQTSAVTTPIGQILNGNELQSLTNLLKENMQPGQNMQGQNMQVQNLSGQNMQVLTQMDSTVTQLQETDPFLNLQDGKMSVKDFLQALSQPEYQESFARVVQTKEFRQILKQAIDDTMRLTPEKVGEEDGIKSFYKQLRGQTEQLSDFAAKQAPDSQLAHNLNDIRSNIDFMNDLNKNMTYFQMPLKFSQSDASGELYVFTNKKELKNGADHLSALLHLDMENLGPLDAYVTLTGNHVSTNFCLESEEMLDFIGSHMNQLEDRLAGLGYSTTFDMKVTDPENDTVNFVENFIEKDQRALTSSQFIFDTKA